MLPSEKKIFDLAGLQAERAKWQAGGEAVVFTNGCFDLLHLGHVDYMERAKALGNRLIVAINTDASVRAQNKGGDRPIQPEQARLRLIAALESVDAVLLFEEETPLRLIEALTPDILVKGADYSVEQIVGAKETMARGGRVETIPLVEGFSTSGIISRIRSFKP